MASDPTRSRRVAPRRIAVVGAGPAGFYAAQALVRSGAPVAVDLFERLPSPHGLVRYGVAPDHATVKSKAFAFDRILRSERVRYFGNVTFGRDLARDELRRHYDAVIYSVGASSDRDLGIPGEELPGSLSATEFVAWYNAHPDHARLEPPLGARHAVVVGLGNVALDVTRALCKDPDELDRTDMAPYAVDALRGSGVRDIHILGRRGPSQANFTPKELREVDELPGVTVLVDPDDLAADRSDATPDADDDPLAARRTARNLELFAGFAERTPPRSGTRVHLRFFVSPVAIEGEARVRAVRLERNRLERRGERLAAVGTGAFERLEAGLLLRSVGYRSEPLPGVPFDEARGVIPSRGGRVTTAGGDAAGEIVPGEYVSGWVRRGPSGVIGTNKTDAAETVANLLADLPALPPAPEPDPAAVPRLLEARGVRYVTRDDWQRIARSERREGGRRHRRAVKFASVEAMLAAAAGDAPSGAAPG